MMNKEKTEAHRLAEKLRNAIHLLDCDFADDIDTNDLKLAAMELESLSARAQELEGQLEAVRAAGGSTHRITHGAPAQTCTCPSGDGSLRWPCPAHPPSAAPVVLPEPFAVYDGEKWYANEEAAICSCATMQQLNIQKLQKVFTEQQVRELLARDLGVEPPQQADARDEEREKLLRALYDRGYEDRAKERDYDPLGASEFDAAMCAQSPTPAATNAVTVLPDGSAFAVYSYPLPKGHWLYAPREYEQGAEEPKELAVPILTHAAREQVVSAIRYAVRAATDCGKETDFDPDALVQNAVYALCGPYQPKRSRRG